MDYTIECRCFEPGGPRGGAISWWYLNTLCDAPQMGDVVEIEAQRYVVIKRINYHFQRLIVARVELKAEVKNEKR